MALKSKLSTTSFRNSLVGKSILVLVLLLLFPIFFGFSLATEFIVFAIFALGYNLLFGYGGQLSFGHAAFFGIGVYGTIMGAQSFGSIYVGIIIGIGAATIIGVVFNWVSLRHRGIYYAMITLALAQMVYYAALQWSGITGGFNGLALTSLNQSFRLLRPGRADLTLFVITLVVLGLTWVGLHRLVNSPFGMILIAVRENEKRAKTLGYNTDRVLLIAATISCFISGIAGALHAVLLAYVNPNILFWTVSGEVVLATLIGGAGTLPGPVIGAIIFEILSNYLPEFFAVWELIFGIIIVFVVLFAPEGIYGYLSNLRQDKTRTAMDIQDLLDRLRS